MPDLDEPIRQDVKEESPYKFTGFDGHLLFLFTFAIIPPFKCDIVVLKFQDPVVGDSYSMRIPPQV